MLSWYFVATGGTFDVSWTRGCDGCDTEWSLACQLQAQSVVVDSWCCRRWWLVSTLKALMHVDALISKSESRATTTLTAAGPNDGVVYPFFDPKFNIQL